MKQKTLTILVVVQSICICLLIYTIVRIRFATNKLLKNNLQNELKVSLHDSFANKFEIDFDVNGAIVWWDQDNGISTFSANYKYFDSVSPFWYELDEAGNINKFTGAESQKLLKLSEKYGVKITPIISNEFKRYPLSNIIASSDKRKEHIDILTAIAKKYDGLSINYENLDRSDRDNYTTFIRHLSDSLHAQGKSLTVHLHAKTENEATWNGPQAQDWKELGRYCDEMKIMAYDYSWSTSKPGPIAPLDWVNEVISYAKTLLPPNKINIGIPLYGYDWTKETNSWLGEGITYQDVLSISSVQGINLSKDKQTNYTKLVYLDSNNNEHEVWIENEETLKEKLVLIKSHDIEKISFWRLGEENNDIWKLLESI